MAVAPSLDLLSASEMLALRSHIAPEDVWSLRTVAGRFVAVEASKTSGSGVLTLIASLIRDAQANDGLVAWVGTSKSIFHPPDFDAAGVDVAALPIVRAPDIDKAARAADTLMRCGSFALIVMDWHAQALPLAQQTRLAGLAHQFHTGLVCIRAAGDARMRGSLVSLRCVTGKKRMGHNCFSCGLRAVKDKRSFAGWGHTEMHVGVDGLC